MPCFSIVSDLKLRKFSGKIRTSSKKSTHNITDSDYSSNHRRNTWKKFQGITFLCKFLPSIWFHTQRKNGTNISSIWFHQINCFGYDAALQKHERNGSLARVWHYICSRCRWSLARRYISTISIYNLPRLRSTSVNRSYKRKWPLTKKRQETNNIP